MAVLARATADELETAMLAAPPLPAYSRLRGPESGLVMIRGRAGGNGASFNLGEMTVSRCTVKTECGRVGHAYVAGRDTRRAELAAWLDAGLQDPARQPALLAAVIEPLRLAQEQAAKANARKAAATTVEFFTLRNMRA